MNTSGSNPSLRVALVGHCGPDSSFLRLAVSKALPGCQIIGADNQAQLDKVLTEGADLLLINRLLEAGYTHTEGLALITQLKSSHPQLRLMLVSNFEDAQKLAVEAGALPGFGKRDIGSPKVTAAIRSALGMAN